MLIKQISRFVLVAIAFAVSSSLWAANGVELNIRLYNQHIYFPEDPIEIRVTIRNNGSDAYRFRLADDRLHNIDFDVRDMDNMNTPPSDNFIRVNAGAQRVFYRDIDLLPGEEFSFIETLNDYRSISHGIYMVRALFYPELRGGSSTQHTIRSNSLTLSVREGFRREEAGMIRVEEAVEEELQTAALAPDEVVAYTLEARMHSRKDQFLQYLDIERLYTDEARREREYTRMSAFERRNVLQEYRDELWNAQTGEGISLIPMNYEILQTSYNPNRGSVTVEQRYDQGEYIEIKRFTYELERRDGIWYIVRYQVINLGTE